MYSYPAIWSQNQQKLWEHWKKVFIARSIHRFYTGCVVFFFFLALWLDYWGHSLDDVAVFWTSKCFKCYRRILGLIFLATGGISDQKRNLSDDLIVSFSTPGMATDEEQATGMERKVLDTIKKGVVSKTEPTFL